MASSIKVKIAQILSSRMEILPITAFHTACNKLNAMGLNYAWDTAVNSIQVLYTYQVELI